MPEIANESLVNAEADPEVPNEDAAPRPSTSTGSVTPVINIPKPGNMIITVGKRKFECVPIEGASDGAEKSKKEKLDEIFKYLGQNKRQRRDLHTCKDCQSFPAAYQMSTT